MDIPAQNRENREDGARPEEMPGGIASGSGNIVLPGTDPSAVCCFTGHRRLPEKVLPQIEEKTAHVVEVLIRAGYRWFLAGGALGFDMLAERIVTEKRRDHPEIRLILALPCRDQTGAWLRLPRDERSAALREYQRLKGLADGICYVSDFYYEGCMKERNRFMIDRSSFCVACYDGRMKSGAGQTWRMAVRAGLKIYNTWPDGPYLRDR